MDLVIMNDSFSVISIFDTFESLIWTDRYCGYGDFEIRARFTEDAVSILREDRYIQLQGHSQHTMIIEDREIVSTYEDGQFINITGRSLESILDRRIIWGQTILSGDFQTAIEKLLNENIISPSIEGRAISNFIFEPSIDPKITNLTINAQFMWSNLYEAICELCLEKDVGFKITLSAENKFIFKLYSGIDRSYNQTENPHVIFSSDFDNLVATNYFGSKKPLKTVTLVMGEGDGLDRKATVVGGGQNLDRREVYTDASDISQKIDDVTLTDAEYASQLAQRGQQALIEANRKSIFDGQVETNLTYKFGLDFFMGDVVQIESEYGLGSASRVTELILSYDLTGIEIFPTFDSIGDVMSTGENDIILVPGGGVGVGSTSETQTIEQLGGLPIAGGTMTGALTLNTDPTNNLHAATKQYADSKLALAGGTMAGVLKAQSNTSYTTAQVRNAILKSSAPTSSEGNNGDICIVYS